jgi:hypothetical protein
MRPASVAQTVASQAEVEEQARLERIRRAWLAYYGQMDRPLRVRPGDPDDNVLLNYARLIVNTTVAFLFGRDIRFEVPGDEAADAWLQECWRANRLMSTITRLGINGAVAGHAVVQVRPGSPFPRVLLVDPMNLSVELDPEDYERVLEYRIQWNAVRDGRAAVRRRRVVRLDGAWEIIDEASAGDAPAWQELAREPWPYEWAPILHCQNLPSPNSFWGMSDLEQDVLHVNRSINFVLSNMARILRHHAHPWVWGRGFSADSIRASVAEIMVLPGADAELRTLEMQSDLASSIELYKRLTEALHKIASVPEVASGKLDSVGQLSGLALQLLYRPLVDMTEVKRSFYGELLLDLNRRLLELGGMEPQAEVVIHWQDILPRDPRTEAETAMLEEQLGASRRTLLSRLGFDPDQEAAQREDEADAAAAVAERQAAAFDRGAASLER